MSEDVAAAPVEIHDDIDASRFHQADLRGRTACPQDDFVFLIMLFPGAETGHHRLDLFFPDAMEERCILQKEIIHDFPPFVVTTTSLHSRL